MENLFVDRIKICRTGWGVERILTGYPLSCKSAWVSASISTAELHDIGTMPENWWQLPWSMLYRKSWTPKATSPCCSSEFLFDVTNNAGVEHKRSHKLTYVSIQDLGIFDSSSPAMRNNAEDVPVAPPRKKGSIKSPVSLNPVSHL